MVIGFIGAHISMAMVAGREPDLRQRSGSRRFRQQDAPRRQIQAKDRAIAFGAFEIKQ
jgi:hypothetical protein